ncbi:hypothetical protein C8Q78DRAFT_446237 [Trametes maxima]|nr:hypothetical protein C8Q78DRAFT_446237 [Trametes maxima]
MICQILLGIVIRYETFVRYCSPITLCPGGWWDTPRDHPGAQHNPPPGLDIRPHLARFIIPSHLRRCQCAVAPIAATRERQVTALAQARRSQHDVHQRQTHDLRPRAGPNRVQSHRRQRRLCRCPQFAAMGRHGALQRARAHPVPRDDCRRARGGRMHVVPIGELGPHPGALRLPERRERQSGRDRRVLVIRRRFGEHDRPHHHWGYQDVFDHTGYGTRRRRGWGQRQRREHR